MSSKRKLALGLALLLLQGHAITIGADHIRDLQVRAFDVGRAVWGHWGPRPDLYNSWHNHTNRLIPVYTFGGDLEPYRGNKSPYRNPESLLKLYGRLPRGTLNPTANYFDQTQLYDLQRRALAEGKKYLFLVIFDGMDWHTTRAAAIYRSGQVSYQQGRGAGLSFQDYRGAKTDFGYMVTAPHNIGTVVDPNAQTLAVAGGTSSGGYHPLLGGSTPWSRPFEATYLTGTSASWAHPLTDSAASATSMNSGIKTYNAAVNTTVYGTPVVPLGRELQLERGFSVGAVTSVPISHATPACAYANNITRRDYQDLTRDMLGLPSISHPSQPLPGLDVLIGAGWGDRLGTDPEQGANYVPGNRYITNGDLRRIAERYEVVTRTPGKSGAELLKQGSRRAAERGRKFFGYFGTELSHLPFQTADGGFDPVGSLRDVEVYTPGDVTENPSLADMTTAAIRVLEKNSRGFWLMVEAGDVDWANHDNNLDNSIGAVFSGVAAFDAITNWAERKKVWDQTLVIVTADHGHLFFLRDPSALIDPARSQKTNSGKPGNTNDR